MWKVICKQDIQLIKSDRLAKWSLLILVVSIIISIAIGKHYTDKRTEVIAAIQLEERNTHLEARRLVDSLYQNNLPFKGNSHRDPTTPNGAANGMGARYFVLEPSPMALISIGQTDLYPNYYKFGLNKKQSLYHEAEILNPGLVYNGYFDLSFVLIYVLPLIIIAFTFNIISSEKEQGTFRILFTGSYSPKKIFCIKYIFRFLLLFVLTAVIIKISLLAAGINLFNHVNELLHLFHVIFWYSAVWFALSMLINFTGFSSGINAAILSGVWLIVLILLPGMMNIIAKKQYPMPSRLELIAETREASDSARQNMNQMLSGFMEDHPELVPEGSTINPNDFAVISLRSALVVEEAIQPLENEFLMKKVEQENIIRKFSFLAQGILLQQIFNRIAGTGEEQFTEFRKQMEEEHDKFRGYFATGIVTGKKMRKKDYQQIPSPVFTKIPVQPLVKFSEIAVLILTVIACLLITLGFFGNLKEIA